jgi:hypothetical protein
MFSGLRVATRTTQRRSNSGTLDKKKILPRAEREEIGRRCQCAALKSAKSKRAQVQATCFHPGSALFDFLLRRLRAQSAMPTTPAAAAERTAFRRTGSETGGGREATPFSSVQAASLA